MMHTKAQRNESTTSDKLKHVAQLVVAQLVVAQLVVAQLVVAELVVAQLLVGDGYD